MKTHLPPPSFVFLSAVAVAHLIDSATQAIGPDPETHRFVSRCVRGVCVRVRVCVFSLPPEVEQMRTGSVCRPGNAFPSEIPNMRQTNLLPTIH